MSSVYDEDTIRDLLSIITGHIWASPRYQAMEYLKRKGIFLEPMASSKQIVEILIGYVP